MSRYSKLSVVVGAAALILSASAFAEDRPSRETRRGSGGRIERRERGTAPSAQAEVRGERSRGGDEWRNNRTEGTRDRTETRTERSDRSEQRADRSTTYDPRSNDRGTYDRNRGSNDRGTYDRNRSSNDRGTYDRNRSDNRGSYDRNNRGSYDRYRGSRGTAYYHQGRVSRYERYGGGYRVWVGGALYPFYVPLALWDARRFRIGIDIRLGGYYNPLGYYDYYDDRYDGYGYGYGSSRSYRTSELTGTVEDYDYRRHTALVRDDVTDALVTVYFRSRDARVNTLRRGDYIETEGGWKGGVFEVYRLFDVD